MTSQEAYQILGVPENADADEIKNKYNELYNEYQIRLTNAPTPNLKKLYQRNLQELNEASDLLLKKNIQGGSKDLPSGTPVFSSTSETQIKQNTPATTYGNSSSKKNEKKDKKGGSSFGVAFGVAAVIALVALTVATFFGISYSENSKEMEKLQKMKSEYGTIDSQLKIFDKQFGNQKFKIKNDGLGSFSITGLIVVYRGDNGTMKKYSSGDQIDVVGGRTVTLNHTQGSAVDWDGSVVSYYCQIKYRNGDWVQAGVWSMDAGDDKMLHLNLDNE